MRQNFVGLVVSQGKNNKTVGVKVSQMVYNKVVGKETAHLKKYLCHDENNLCRVGDIVRIIYSGKLLARKAFLVAQIKRSLDLKFHEYQDMASELIPLENNFRNQQFLDRQAARQAELEFASSMRWLYATANKPLLLVSEEEVARMEHIKLQYGITLWPPSGEQFETELQHVRRQLQESVQLVESGLAGALDRLVRDETKSQQVLEAMGRGSVTKQLVKKNLLRTYLLKNPDQVALLGL